MMGGNDMRDNSTPKKIQIGLARASGGIVTTSLILLGLTQLTNHCIQEPPVELTPWISAAASFLSFFLAVVFGWINDRLTDFAWRKNRLRWINLYKDEIARIVNELKDGKYVKSRNRYHSQIRVLKDKIQTAYEAERYERPWLPKTNDDSTPASKTNP